MASNSHSTPTFGPHVTHVNGQPLTPTKGLTRRVSNPLAEVQSTDSRRNSPSTADHRRALQQLDGKVGITNSNNNNENSHIVSDVALDKPNFQMPTQVHIPEIEIAAPAESRPDLSPRTKQLMSFWQEKERNVVKPASSADGSPIISNRIRNSIFLPSPNGGGSAASSPARPLPASPTKPLNFNKTKHDGADIDQPHLQQRESPNVRPLNFEKRSSLMSSSGSLRSKKVTFEMAPPQVLEFEAQPEQAVTSSTLDDASWRREQNLHLPARAAIDRPSSPLAKYDTSSSSPDSNRPQRTSSVRGARPLPAVPVRPTAAAAPKMEAREEPPLRAPQGRTKRNSSMASEYDAMDVLNAYDDSDEEPEMETVAEEEEIEKQEVVQNFSESMQTSAAVENDSVVSDEERDEVVESIVPADVLSFISYDEEVTADTSAEHENEQIVEERAAPVEVEREATSSGEFSLQEEPITNLDSQLASLEVRETIQDEMVSDEQLETLEKEEEIVVPNDEEKEETSEPVEVPVVDDEWSDDETTDDADHGEDILENALNNFKSPPRDEMKAESEVKQTMTKSTSTGSFMELPFEADEKESTLGFDEYLNSNSFLSRDWSQNDLSLEGYDSAEFDTAVLLDLPKGRASAVQTIKSASGARTRPSMTPGDIHTLTSEVRKASGGSGQQRFFNLPDYVDELPGSPSRRRQLLDLDFGEDDSFDLEKEFDQVVEVQKRGYLMRQNTRVVYARAISDFPDESPMAQRLLMIPGRGGAEPMTERNTQPQEAETPVKKTRNVPLVAPAVAPHPPAKTERDARVKAQSMLIDDEKVATTAPSSAAQSSKAMYVVPADLEAILSDPAEQVDPADRGRLFVKVLALKDMKLPESGDDSQMFFTLTLDNGIHCNAAIYQEFELIASEDLEFILTLKVKVNHPTAPTSRSPSPTKKNGKFGFDKLFASSKRRFAPQSESLSDSVRSSGELSRRSDAVEKYLGADGSFARSYISLQEIENEVRMTSKILEIPCYNEWTKPGHDASKPRRAQKDAQAPYPVGKIVLQLLFFEKLYRSQEVPRSLNACLRLLNGQQQQQ
ncbi:hypothetical protein BZA70DRAFT_268228 [Myxozyma melibiosi]|uniref:Uncharacterized protein n=1 Tax=Myxozyma melibiosi TaxID=54550 RepID=A0ABR1F3F8_9ASCO